MPLAAKSLVIRLGLDLSEFNRRLRGIGKSLSTAGQQIGAVGRSLSLRLTAPIVAFGAASTIAFLGFEKGMNRVQALTGATADEFAQLEAQAKELGRTTQFSAAQAAQAMGELARSGFSVDEIMSALPKTLQLAAAGQVELAEAADITTNILRGLRLDTRDLGKANDVLAKAFTSANVDIRQLGQAFKFVGPVTRATGLQFEEVTGVLALLGDAGIQASMAGTSLRAAIASLRAPGGQAAQVIKDLGLQVDDGTGKMRPFVEILQQLERAAITDAQAFQLFGRRAAPAMLALIGQSGRLREFNQNLADSGGTAEKIAKIQMRGLTGALLRMKSALEGAAIQIGARLRPFLERLAVAVTKVSTFISQLDDDTLGWVLAISGAVALIGPLLVGLGALVGAVGFVATGIAALGGAFAFLTTTALPWLIIAAAVAASLAAIGILVLQVVKNWDFLRAEAEALVSPVFNAFNKLKLTIAAFGVDVFRVLQSVAGFFKPVIDTIAPFVDTVGGFFKSLVDTAKVWLIDNFGGVINKLINLVNTAGFLFDDAFDPFEEIPTKVAGKASDAIAKMNKDFADGFQGMTVSVKSAMDTIRPLVATGVADISKNLKELAADVGIDFDGIAGSIGSLFAQTTDQVGAATAEMQSRMRELTTGMQENVVNTRSIVGEQWAAMMDEIRVSATDVMEVMVGLWDQFKTGVGDAIGSAIIGSESLRTSLQNLAKSILKNLIGAIVKLGIQWFVQAKAAAGAASIQGAAVISKNLAGVYSGAFSATAAIPVIGPKIAPGIASAALSTAAGGSKAASALGAAIGAKPFQFGGIVRKPTVGLVGEAGPEAVLPLARLDQFLGARQQMIVVELDGEILTRRVVQGLPDEVRVATGFEF